MIRRHFLQNVLGLVVGSAISAKAQTLSVVGIDLAGREVVVTLTPEVGWNVASYSFGNMRWIGVGSFIGSSLDLPARTEAA